MITVTGWTWEYIDEYMTLPRLEELTHYWASSPPTHLLVKQFMSDPESSSSSEPPSDAELQAFVSSFKG